MDSKKLLAQVTDIIARLQIIEDELCREVEGECEREEQYRIAEERWPKPNTGTVAPSA